MSGAQMQQEQLPVKVAVLGGSAGGIDAFTSVLSGLPDQPGFAVLVISHLDPTRQTQLDTILQRHTSMPVERLAHLRKIEHDRVYVLPEDATLTALDGHFRVTKREPGLHRPIDICLASMAQDPDVEAAAVILSGTGSDGAAGIVDLKASGGLVLVQSPASAEHDGMPIASIDTGLVDEVLLYIAPLLLGDRGRPLFDGLDIDAMAERRRLRTLESRSVGDDLRLLLRPIAP